MYDEILLDTEERMDKALDHLRNNLAGFEPPGKTRSRRLYPSGVLWFSNASKQLANVGLEPQQIVIRPYDPSVIKDIEKAIVASDLGYNPQGDGRLIRINVPALSGEVRKKMLIRIKELSEEAKVSIRNVRRDGNKAAELRVKKTTP